MSAEYYAGVLILDRLFTLDEAEWQALRFKCTPDVLGYPRAILLRYLMGGIVIPSTYGFFVNTAALQDRNGHFPVPFAVNDGIP
jgi:hypothetical protein